MPSAERWGDEGDEEEVARVDTKTGKQLPEPQEIVEGNLRKVITYSINEDGKIEKKTRHFQKEKRTFTANKAMLKRREWSKFGDAKGHAKGPDAGTTSVADEVFLVLRSKQQPDEPVDDPTTMKKKLADKKVVCRLCKGNHWTTKCPYKDNIAVQQTGGFMAQMEGAAGAEGEGDEGEAPAAGGDGVGPMGGVSGGRYISPAHRAGRAGGGDSMSRHDDSATVRVTNISENTREEDLRDLFRPFGHITRCYLATDRETGAARGFAFISFMSKDEAQAAIDNVSGHGYDHLILHVEWAKPPSGK